MTYTTPTSTSTYTVGFDSIFDRLDKLSTRQFNDKYPPHNVVKHDEDNFEVAIAVAGFKENDLNVKLEDRTLTVSSTDVDLNGDKEYIHKGIATRKFQKAFELGEFIEVKEVTLADGILSIYLEKNVPEEQKPKTFTINSDKAEFLAE